MKVDIAITPETAKTLRGTTVLDKNIMIYSGVPQGNHASEEVAIVIKK